MTVTTTDDSLTLRLTKREMVNALRSKVVIPKSTVTSVEWKDVFKDWPPKELRIGGTYLPGVIMAGSYISSRGWDFVYAHKPKGWTRPELREVLVITTNRKRYRRIILSMPKSSAKEYEAWAK